MGLVRGHLRHPSRSANEYGSESEQKMKINMIYCGNVVGIFTCSFLKLFRTLPIVLFIVADPTNEVGALTDYFAKF